MKTKTIFQYGIALFVGYSTLISCVDKNYDLSNVDGNINIGGESMMIPISSIDQLVLKNLLDTTDVFTIVDGKYKVRQEGDMNIDPVTIDDVTVDSPDIPVNETSMDRNSVIATSMKMSKRNNGKFDCSYIIKKNAVDIQMKATPVTTNVTRIDNISSVPTELKMDINMGDLWKHLKQLRAASFQINIPKGFDISQIKLNGENILREESQIQALKEGIITFPEEMIIKPTGNELSIVINGGKIATNPQQESAFYFDEKTNTIKINGQVSVEGELGFNQEDITDESKGINDIPLQANLSVESSMAKTIVEKFTGAIQYDINVPSIKPISLACIPEFLKDDDVVLDLKNPKIIINVKNNELPVNAKFNLKLTSYGKKNQILHSTTINDIIINKSGATTCTIVDTKSNDTNGIKGQIIRGDISELIRTVPEYIKAEVFDAEIEPQDVSDFDITKSYNIEDANYIIDSDLNLGDDFRIVYRDTISGWHKDIKDIAIKKITMSGNVHSELPVDVSMSIKPIDIQGKQLPYISFNQASITAKGDSKIYLEAEIEGNTTEEIIQRFSNLDGIIIKAIATKNEHISDVTLTPEDYIVIDNVKIVLIGGVYINTEK